MKHTINHKVLDNKAELTIISVPDSSVVEMRVFFKAGFEYFNAATYHVPHVLEHLLVGNSKRFKNEDEFTMELQTLGAEMNASTSYTHVMFEMRAPSTMFADAFSLAMDSIFNPRLSEENLEEQKNIILREISERFDSVGNQVVSNGLARAFPGLLNQQWNEDSESIAQISLKDIKSAFKAYIRPDNMHVLLAGNISKADAKGAERFLSELQSQTEVILRRTELEKALPFFEGESMQDGDDNGSLTFMFKSSTSDETLKDRISKSFAGMLLLGAPTAVLPKQLRKKGIVYSVDFDEIDFTDSKVQIIHAIMDAKQAHEAAVEILHKLRAYAAGHIPEAEFKSVKSYVVNMISTSVETVSHLCEWYSRDITNDRPLSTPEDEIKIVKSLKVQDVAQATNQLYVESELYGAALCDDAASWADRITTLHASTDLSMSEKEIASYMKSELAEIQYERTKFAQIRGGWWRFYYLSSFASVLSAVFVSQLPVIGEKGTTSLSDFALHNDHLWGMAFFIPFLLANILLFFVVGKKEVLATRIAIMLNLIAAALYLVGLMSYFGDSGTDDQSFIEDVISIFQPVFFLLMTPIAFIVTAKNVLLERTWIAIHRKAKNSKMQKHV